MHNSIIVREHLNNAFENRYLWPSGVVAKVHRSHFFGFFYEAVFITVTYAYLHINLQDSKNKTIYNSRQLMEQHNLTTTLKEINRRLEAYLSANRTNYIRFIR